MNQQAKTHYWVVLLPLIAVLIWSLNVAVTRYVADYISPISISFYRWFVAFLILSPFMLGKVIQEWSLIRPHLAKLAILSAFGMLFYQGIAYAAAHYTSATNMGIINAFIPIFTIFVSMMILKEFPSKFAVIGSLLSFSGLVFVIAQGDIASLAKLGGHLGDLLMIAAVFFYAFYGVFLKKWQLNIPLMSSLYIQICFVILFHLPFIALWGLDRINTENISSVLYAGIFPSLIAPLVWMLSIEKNGPNRTSIFMNLMPVFTALIAYFWLKEAWTIYHSIGGVVIILGIILAQKKTKVV